MNTLELWAGLHKVALLGTARAGEMLALPEDAPASLRSALESDREGALLSLLAACSLQRRAGALAPALEAADVESSVCPDESRPVAPPVACSRLRSFNVFNSGEAPLLLEWLELARAHQVLAPHDWLPALLLLGSRSKAARRAVAAVLGERGRWLAAQNPEWKWARGEALDQEAGADQCENLFLHGEGEARVGAFARLRALDAGRALQVLAGAWKSEPADKRRHWIEMLQPELSDEDEAFLESVLDDRSEPVRRIAAETLVALPGSAFAGRAFERARKYLRAEHKEGVLVIEAGLPAEWDESWARDGIEEKSARLPSGTAAVGYRSWWLRQMLSLTPPSRWQEAWQCEPRSIFEALGRADKSLLEGVALAAVRSGESAWLQALLLTTAAWQLVQAASGRHISRLQAGERDGLLAQMVREVQAAGDTEQSTIVLSILAEHREPWGAELSRQAIAWMQAIARRTVEQALPQNFNLWSLPGGPILLRAPQIAPLLNLEALAQAQHGWPHEAAHPAILSARDHLAASFETRSAMRREFIA